MIPAGSTPYNLARTPTMTSAVSGFSRHHFEEFLRKMLRDGIPSQTLQCLDNRDAIAAQNKINKIKSHARKEVLRAQEGVANPITGTPFDNISLSVDGNLLIVMNVESTGMKLDDFVISAAPAANAPPEPQKSDIPDHWSLWEFANGVEAQWHGTYASGPDGVEFRFPDLDTAKAWCAACDRTGAVEPPTSASANPAPKHTPNVEELF